MKKKVYATDLSIEEVVTRLNKGEKLYLDEIYGEKRYYQKINGEIVNFEDDVPKVIGGGVRLREMYNNYFLEEVEEPEADESCIGKVCAFWNNTNTNKKIGVLDAIDTEDIYVFHDNGGEWYVHCKALTKEEALALVKE